jgi:hypothetical protein
MSVIFTGADYIKDADTVDERSTTKAIILSSCPSHPCILHGRDLAKPEGRGNLSFVGNI